MAKRAIEITQFGGPEVLRVVERPAPEAGPGMVLVDVTAAGVNYADTHTVEKLLPRAGVAAAGPRREVAGTTPDGTRVVGLVGSGGYAEQAAVPEATAFAIPDAVSDAQALALVVQGTAAWHLLRTSAGGPASRWWCTRERGASARWRRNWPGASVPGG